jgi:hypothetical protein
VTVSAILDFAVLKICNSVIEPSKTYGHLAHTREHPLEYSRFQLFGYPQEALVPLRNRLQLRK